MGSVPGPVIKFRIDSAAISGAVKPAFDEVRTKAKTTSDAIAAEWKTMTAQVRANIASGFAVEKDVVAQRQQIVATLNKEIEGLRTREQLTKSQLADLKAATLELERQQNFLKGGPGLTSGTLGFAGLISNFLNRTAGQIGAGLFGVQGGSQLGSAAGGIGEAILGGAGTTAVLGAFATAALAAAAAMRELAKSGAEYVKNIDIVSQKTGISVRDLQVLEAAGQSVNVSLDDIVIGFRKFSKALVGDSEGGEEGATEASQKFKQILKDLGVSSKDPKEAMLQVADAFQKLDNGAVKADVAVTLFGKSGLNQIALLNKGREGIDAFAMIVDQLGPKITPGLTKKTEDWERANTELSESVKKLTTDVADRYLPSMTTLEHFISRKMIPAIDGLVKGEGGSANSVGGGRLGRIFLGLEPQDWQGSSGIFPKATNQSKELADKLAKDLATGADKAAAAMKKLAEETRRFFEQFTPRESFSPGRIGETNQERVDKIIQNILNPKPGIIAPEIPVSGAPDLKNLLSGFSSVTAKPPLDALALLNQVNKEHEDLFKTQEQKDREHYAEELQTLNDALKQQLITQGEYSDALIKLKQDEAKTLEDLANQEERKFQKEAGSLFDALVSGNAKGFADKFKNIVEGVALAPIKQIFEKFVGGELDQLSKIFNGIFGKKTPGAAGSGGGTVGAAGSPGGILGGIFGGITGIGPGGTAGWFPGGIGIGGSTSTAGVGVHPGLATQSMFVTAGTVYLTGTLGVPGSGGLGGSNLFGNFFGNLNPFGGSSAVSGGIGGIGATAGSAGSPGGVLQSLGPFIAGGALVGIGAGTNNPSAMAMGATMIAKTGLTLLSNAGKISGSTAAGLGGVVAGAGLFASGIEQGGFTGALETTAGGAMAGGSIGMMVGGPAGALIGAGIGAAVGLVTGIVNGIFGGPSYNQKVKNAMEMHNYIAPPGETFSFGMGATIGQTLSTGFAQSGNRITDFGLAAGTPFYASALTGKLNDRERYLLQLEQDQILTNQPFGGPGNGTNPFLGQGPLGNRARNLPSVSVNINLPGLVDPHMADAVFTQHAQLISRLVTAQVGQSASGFGHNVRRAAFLP
jgi:hypothetical protein